MGTGRRRKALMAQEQFLFSMWINSNPWKGLEGISEPFCGLLIVSLWEWIWGTQSTFSVCGGEKAGRETRGALGSPHNPVTWIYDAVAWRLADGGPLESAKGVLATLFSNLLKCGATGCEMRTRSELKGWFVSHSNGNWFVVAQMRHRKLV